MTGFQAVVLAWGLAGLLWLAVLVEDVVVRRRYRRLRDAERRARREAAEERAATLNWRWPA